MLFFWWKRNQENKFSNFTSEARDLRVFLWHCGLKKLLSVETFIVIYFFFASVICLFSVKPFTDVLCFSVYMLRQQVSGWSSTLFFLFHSYSSWRRRLKLREVSNGPLKKRKWNFHVHEAERGELLCHWKRELSVLLMLAVVKWWM